MSSLKCLDELIGLLDKETSTEKVVFVAMEFVKDTIFSGNGVYARTIVSALLKSKFQVLVICASNQIKQSMITDETMENDEKCKLLIIPVNQWKQLNWQCDYKLFASNFIKSINIIDEFKPNYLLFVDFSSLMVVENIIKYSSMINIDKVKKIFLNFRVFHNNANLTDNQHKQEKDLYIKLETQCCKISDVIIALNQNELCLLKSLLLNETQDMTDEVKIDQDEDKQFSVLHPPLRVDVERIAIKLNQDKDNKVRNYFLCCCRISKEKNVEIFVKCVEILQDFLFEKNIIPYLCGSANETNKEYQEMLYNRLNSCKCKCITSSFVKHEQLCTNVYNKTLLNFHPAIKEPYGMVIVECAAHSVASITHKSDIGANELLKDATFTTDMTNEKSVAQDVKKIFENLKDIHKMGNIAKQIGLAYNIDSFGKRLQQLVSM